MRQRADLTFKQNAHHGRHGWLRLTPAYSVKLVEQILGEFGEGAESVLEPFSGSGTTALCASYRGMRAVAADINPFLVWLGRVKNARYDTEDELALRAEGAKISRRLRARTTPKSEPPPLKNIERWWGPAELSFVTRLRAEVERAPRGPLRDLLKVAFCRTMIALSNAAFNHQSMSFKAAAEGSRARAPLRDPARFFEQFTGDVAAVADTLLDNPNGKVRIEQMDARTLGARARGPFDLLITSPPYPNRMSYVRELRPYMYWLGFLDNAKDAGELDWTAIGGTWGIATSRLLAWQPSDAYVPSYLTPIVKRIVNGHPKNGELMARYVRKYFDDMFSHFQTAAKLVRAGGTAHYIVGNSTFYGELVPADRLYVDQLKKAGFRKANARAIRKRNSKRQLIEFHVIAER
ncbi:MAG TPA: hypothetical protein VGI10_24330 [Polyangiaceae bacterium]|jgi:hypothetical protein